MEGAKQEVVRKTLSGRNQLTELERLRHSCAHVLATAVLRIWPNARLDIGPPTKEGFYYDFDLDGHRFSPKDSERIEAEMKEITRENQVFQRRVKTREEAIAHFKKAGQKFKLERINDIPEGEEISFYQNGEFIDLCAGPHVMRTGNIKAFKLLKVASAYYRGNEKNPQLQRIYGTAFPKEAELEAWLEAQEEARRRDHRKIGKEMALFTFDDDVGPGLPLWLPKGTVLIEELEKLAKETEFAAGYQRVRTPHLAKESLYRDSGHLPYYAESMFPPMEVGEGDDEADCEIKDRYYLKAMNCPHHHKIFAAVPRSYRDLPMRLAEYGVCYRYEQSGELMGLMRVRSMQMNDAHIYCSAEQFADEFRAVNEMYLKYFEIFGFEKYQMRFSTHDPAKLGEKFVDDPELWKQTEAMVRDVLVDSGINFVEIANEAAFYGPKIDVQVWSISGREFTIATNQVDFAVPPRLGLAYKTSDNTLATPLCIHRAPLGTHERFIAFLIEHYAGNFPLWLAPEQVRVLPIGGEPVEFAREVYKDLRESGIRAEIDAGRDKINGKIQNAEQAKVHTMLVVGRREAAAGSVSVRVHGKGNVGVQPWSECLDLLQETIRRRQV
ncbi:MAG: Threonine--tRNA ligase 1 [Verrucomicrobia subdivision 3 bacterium]|nr:Threonine--tRNA ligase 1 [Limisphaerales bacterium]MCS1413476.1 Threonine--tRNA ligase 1 [Limisphaerales bacterium]